MKDDKKPRVLMLDKPGDYTFTLTQLRILDPDNLPPGFSTLRPETWGDDDPPATPPAP